MTGPRSSSSEISLSEVCGLADPEEEALPFASGSLGGLAVIADSGAGSPDSSACFSIVGGGVVPFPCRQAVDMPVDSSAKLDKDFDDSAVGVEVFDFFGIFGGTERGIFCVVSEFCGIVGGLADGLVGPVPSGILGILLVPESETADLEQTVSVSFVVPLCGDFAKGSLTSLRLPGVSASSSGGW
eukprot:SAG31_NODE_2646_length_5307_cov_1.777074_2_plen_185_part_00